jgi:hypothetical protein
VGDVTIYALDIIIFLFLEVLSQSKVAGQRGRTAVRPYKKEVT